MSSVFSHRSSECFFWDWRLGTGDRQQITPLALAAAAWYKILGLDVDSGSWPVKRISRAAERYSNAFFQAVKSAELLDGVEEDFKLLSRLIEEDSELKVVLSNPLISRQDLESFLVAFGEKLKLQDLTIIFLRLLARRRRTTVLKDIIYHFRQLLQQDRNQFSVGIQTHTPISKSQLEKIKMVLGDRTKQDIIVDVTVDPSILGGIVLRYGSHKLDFSLKSKLSDLKHELERLS